MPHVKWEPETTPPVITVRSIFKDIAAKKAFRAFRRHGEHSLQFQKAKNSRWLA